MHVFLSIHYNGTCLFVSLTSWNPRDCIKERQMQNLISILIIITFNICIMIIICKMAIPLLSTFLAHYQQCVQPWKQQWLSWQLPAALPAALRNELVSQFHLEAQSERGNQQSLSNSNCHSTTSAKQKRKKQLMMSREESCW